MDQRSTSPSTLKKLTLSNTPNIVQCADTLKPSKEKVLFVPLGCDSVVDSSEQRLTSFTTTLILLFAELHFSSDGGKAAIKINPR